MYAKKKEEGEEEDEEDRVVGQEEYVGYWKGGKKEGKKTLLEVDGGKYVGDFHNDLCEGRGVYTTAGGDCYEGEWKWGMKQRK